MRDKLKAFSNQGLTTVVGKNGATRLLYRGDLSIPRAVKHEGWVHVGSPDSARAICSTPTRVWPPRRCTR